MKAMTRRACLAALLATLPILQGCFPVIATGVGAGALMIADRRTSGAYVEDEGIELKAANRLDDRFHDQIHVNVTSFNRHLLLTGEAPNETVREEMGRIAAAVANVKGVVNEVQIGGNSSLSARANDTYLTSKVKARFIDSDRIPAHIVKVVTEASTVFLLGIVTQREGDAAAELASTTSGVRKVVRVFEYVSPEQAWEMDRRPKADAPQTKKD